MKITKKDTYSTIDEPEEQQEILYCAHCDRFGVTAILQHRPNYNKEDKELWRYCDNCKRIQPATSGTRRGILKGVVDPVDTPFETVNITGLENKTPKSYIAKYREQLLKKANKEKDSEIRREILKGMDIDEGLKEE
jgi:hypothetical protein